MTRRSGPPSTVGPQVPSRATAAFRPGALAGQDREQGSASVLVLGLIVALMLVAGLVVDGGRAVNARAELMDDAEQAARAGANQLDLGVLRSSGDVVVDVPAARQAAVAHLSARGYDTGRVSVTADQNEVAVTVRDDVQTALLSLIFIHSFEVEGSAAARAAAGITDELSPGAP